MLLEIDKQSTIHVELSSDKKEVEFYVLGWFVASASIEDISPEAKEALFINE